MKYLSAEQIYQLKKIQKERRVYKWSKAAGISAETFEKLVIPGYSDQKVIGKVLIALDPSPRELLTPEQMISMVAEAYGMTSGDIITTQGREPKKMEAKQIAVYVLEKHTRLSLKKISSLMGYKDHTSVTAALAAFEARWESPGEAVLRQFVRDLRAKIQVHQ